MKKILLLLLSFLIYSSAGVFSKLASLEDFLSTGYIINFSIALLALVIFAILWQKILAIMPLNKAFLCKSICVIISMSYAYIIFNESITLNNIIGATLIIAGLSVLSAKKTTNS